MYLSEPLKLAWVRVPKTGSTSFKNATQDAAKWKELGADHGTLFDDEVPEGYTTLITIRNPYDWVRSVYGMCIGERSHWGVYVNEESNKRRKSVDAFFTFFKKTQLDWVRNPDGAIEVDEVVCIENVTEFFSKHGVPLAGLGHENKTNSHVLGLFEWTKERRIWVRRKFAAELKFYPNDIANSK